MREVATIGLMMLPNGDPGVRFNGSLYFGDVPVVTKIALLIAAIQLCGAAINSICEENPDDNVDIEAMMNAVTITPSAQSVN